MEGRIITAAIAAVALLSTAGCGAGAGSTNGGGGDETKGGSNSEQLSVGFVAAPPSLDFTQDDGAAIPQALLVNVYEGLVELDENGEIVPALAKDWTTEKNGTVYNFELVENAEFSNGKPFTAQDAVFSINRVKTDWKLAVASAMDVVKKAEAVDDHTLRVTLKTPSNMWLNRMTTRIGAMFPEGDVDKLATEPVGTGPYQVADWKPGNAMTLERRDAYWGEDPDVDKVVLRYFDNPSSMNNALKSGSIDVISTVQTPESLEQFEKDDRFTITEGTTNGEVVLALNNDAKPLDDKRVRQAIRHAIDHKELIEGAWAGYGTEIGSMVPPTDPWYEDLTGLYPYDKQKAKQLLKQAGYSPGDLTLRMRIPTLPYAENAAQVVRSQLAEIGVDAKIDPLAFPDRWLEEVHTSADYDISIISHVEPWDLITWTDPEYYWKYDSKKFRNLIAEADQAPTQKEFVAKMSDAARVLSEDAAADFLFLLPNLMVTTKDVEGLPTNVVSEAFDVTAISKK